jgi:hypothetical protein
MFGSLLGIADVFNRQVTLTFDRLVFDALVALR